MPASVWRGGGGDRAGRRLLRELSVGDATPMGREPLAWAASGTKSAGEAALATPSMSMPGATRQHREHYAAAVACPRGIRGEATVCEAPLPAARVAARKH